MGGIEVTFVWPKLIAPEIMAVMMKPEDCTTNRLKPMKPKYGFLPVPLQVPQLNNRESPLVLVERRGSFSYVLLEFS